MNMEERNKEMIKSPPDNYYINKKSNNLIRSHTYSHDYKSPKNYSYKNGNIMNNYDNFELNIINDNYDNGINYYTCYNLMTNCNRCSNEKTCIECFDNYFTIFASMPASAHILSSSTFTSS